MDILNYVNGEWIKPEVSGYFDVVNPATGETVARTPLCGQAEIDAAAKAASEAFPAWRRTPVQDRVQYLFRLRNIMREHGDEIAKLITQEAGKTFEEAKAEMVRAFENIEVACGMPHLGKGELVEDIAPGIHQAQVWVGLLDAAKGLVQGHLLCSGGRNAGPQRHQTRSHGCGTHTHKTLR